jgi:glycosyltransferase involved in cell wall biosynthesis
VDVVFHPHQHSLPMWSGIPCAALVLDLLPLVFRRQFPTARVLYYDTLVRAAAGRQNALFTISEASKADVVKYLGISADRIAVLPLAAAQTLRRQDHGCAAAATRRFMLRRPFVLYVGNARPHKNVAGLVAAFARAGLARDCDLVVVGRDDPSEPERDYRPVHRQIEQLGLGDAVRFIGDVTDAELAALYSLAAVVPVVSFYEGFGLPALEAMACGAPVVAARAGALPEVTGNAALLVDPYDVGEIAAMLRSAVSDGAVAERLRDAGLRRAREFSWRRTATQLLSTLESLAS